MTDEMRGFSLTLADFDQIGTGLHRPECVLTTAAGDLYVSNERGGVTRIRPDGSTEHYLGQTSDGHSMAANGFAMLPDGSFLIAPLSGGGVFRLSRDGQAEPFLREADGAPLHCPNFVLHDDRDRLWICCLTRQDRTTLSRYSRDRRDGFIVLVERGRARIVADCIGFPNEVRVDPTGSYLYTNETLAARLLRYSIRADHSLGPPEVILDLDPSNMFDGFTLDAAGGAWITALVSNRLWYVSPAGEPRVLIEDANPELLARLVDLQTTTGVVRSVLYEESGSMLRNISSIAFGGPGLQTAYLGSLLGTSVLSFRSPVAGMKPTHWDFFAA